MGNLIVFAFSAVRTLSTMPFAWMQRLRDRVRPRSGDPTSAATTDIMEGVPENLQEHLNVIINAVNHVESCANTACDTCRNGVALVKETSGNSGLDQERIGDLMAERTSFSQIFVACWQKGELLQRFVDASETSDLSGEAQRSFEFYRALAGICWNYTDESDAFCLRLEAEGGLRILVDWMLSRQDKASNKWATELVFNVLNILHNACRRIENIRRSYRRIVPALEKLAASEDLIVQACALMTLSYMVDKEEADKLTTNAICVDRLHSLLKRSLENVEHKIRITRSTGTDAFRQTFTLSSIELVQGIEQLAINDKNKRLIVEKEGITILARMLEMDCTAQEKRHAAEGLWRLAFLKENKVKLREEHDMIKELITLSCGPDPALNRACKGALFEICSSKLPEEVAPTTGKTGPDPQAPSTTADKPSQHIMISYRWEQPSKSVMSEIKNQLKSRGYNVWMDEDFMSGDIIEKMATAVENSYLILACITEGYQESKNCRTEATYAYDQNKRIVPVKVDERFKARGWLGGITAGKIYYPVPDVDQVPKQLPRIIDLEIEDELQKNPEAQPGARGAASAEPDIPSWDVTKVREWLTTNGISSTNESLQSLTGTQLLQLKKQHSTAPDTFYQSMKEDLKVPYMEVLSLAAALEKL